MDVIRNLFDTISRRFKQARQMNEIKERYYCICCQFKKIQQIEKERQAYFGMKEYNRFYDCFMSRDIGELNHHLIILCQKMDVYKQSIDNGNIQLLDKWKTKQNFTQALIEIVTFLGLPNPDFYTSI
jgi:hypothetical protein